MPYATPTVQRQASVAPTGAAPKPPASAPPSFQSYLDADPGYQGALANQNLGKANADTSLAHSLSGLLVDFGSPVLASQLQQYGYSLNPNDATAAQANYNAGNAILARLDQAHNLNRQSTINALAAHGLINSGDTGYRLGQVDQGYGQGLYDATQNELNQAFNLQQNNLATKNSLNQSIAAALQSAWQNFMANPGAYAQAPAAPNPPPSYEGPNGDTVTPQTYASLGVEPSPITSGMVAPPLPQPDIYSQPYAVNVTANRTGASANRKQGVFSIH